VIRHAFLPALLSYIALMYLVHLEALKAGMEGRARPGSLHLRQRLLRWGISTSGLILFLSLTWLLLDGVSTLFGEYSLYANALLLLACYLGILFWEAKYPQAERLDADHLPNVYQALREGLHFLLPIVVLVWCLMVLRLSPASAVFYAILLLLFIIITQKPLRHLFAGESTRIPWGDGVKDLIQSLHDGAKNMIGIGVATATAGIVVGTVSLTGIGQVLGELIELLSMGSVIAMLLLTALVCMVLGMGLPTTANYIVVSTLMAPVIAQFATANGLDIPLVAIHLFVFYFGILADDTPPVGLAAYAASGISGADPIKTGIQSFFYDIRTAILPFMFIFNTELLMIGVDGIGHFLWVATIGLAAMLAFAAATQGWFITRSRWWESLLLLLIAFSLFRPDFWLDRFFPPYTLHPATELEQHYADADTGEGLRLRLRTKLEDATVENRTLTLPLPDSAPGDRLEELGFITEPEGSSLKVTQVGFMSAAENAGVDAAEQHWIVGFELPATQPAKEWFLLPPLLLAMLLGLLQQRRKLRSIAT
jgi:TRAP transporter 4TM/12TM fusion protein